jgi:serine/threonine-protein kinase
MIKCRACAAELPDTSRFCSSCGLTLSPELPVSLTPTEAVTIPTPAARTPTAGSRVSSSGSLDEGRFPPGTLLADRYRIIALLGRGGMGEVYRANDIKLGQPVALKCLPEATAHNPAIRARFHSEVRIARQVSHPNVCRVYDIGEVEGQPNVCRAYDIGETIIPCGYIGSSLFALLCVLALAASAFKPCLQAGPCSKMISFKSLKRRYRILDQQECLSYRGSGWIS